MTKKRFEKTLAALLFVMVLVLFSFAERDSKKLERFFSTAQALKRSSNTAPNVVVKPSLKPAAVN